VKEKLEAPTKPQGLVKTLLKKIPSAVKTRLKEFDTSERERLATQTIRQRAVTELIERPAKIGKFLAVDMPVAFVSTLGKTIGEHFQPSREAQVAYRAEDKPIDKIADFLKVERSESWQQIKEAIDEYTKDSPVATPWEKENLGLTVAIAGFAADAFFPGGKKKLSEKAIQELVKTVDTKLVADILVREGVPRQLAEAASEKVALARTTQEVNEALKVSSQNVLRTAAGTSEEITPSQATAIPKTVKGTDDITASISKAKASGQSGETITLYRAAPKFPPDKFDVGTYFADDAGKARYYSESHYKGNPADIKVEQFTLPKSAVFREPSTGNYILKGEAPVQRAVANDLTTSIKSAKQSGQSFDEWVKGQKATDILRTRATALNKEADNLVVRRKQLSELTAIEGTAKATRENRRLIGEVEKIDKRIAQIKKEKFNLDSLLKAEWDGVSDTEIAPSQFGVSREVAADLEEAIARSLPEQTPQRARVVQELQSSRLIASLPPNKQIPVGKSIAEEYSKWSKAKATIASGWTKIREVAQDSFIRARKLQQAVTGKKVTEVPENINIDLAETLFHGRVHTRLEEVKGIVTKIDRDIVKTSKTLGITDDVFKTEIDSFLHARHALERNAKLGDGAAGLTNAEAKAILATIEKSPHKAQILKIAEEIQAVNRQTLQTLLDAQVIDKELFDLLTKTYKNHVPLQRVMGETDDVVDVLSARGFDVKTTGIRRAVGSDKPVADILTNVAANVEAAVVRAEKNLVDLTTLRFARANKDLGLFEEISPKAIGKTFEGDKILFQQVTDPSVLALRENGKPVYLKVNDPRLAVTLKGVSTEKVPTLLRGIAFVTRIYAGLHTRFNYEFAFSNLVRDTQEMMVEVANRRGFREAASAGKKQLFESKKSIVDFLMGKDTAGAKLYVQMKMDGGTTGGLAASTRQQVQLDIVSIRAMNRSNPRAAAIKAIEMIDKWNTIFEDATRLSAYKTALEGGASRKQAAFLAKESSVNFNKKGTAGPIINGLYMFSNASIQGTTKVLRAMKNPKVAGAVIGSVGATVYAVNEWNTSVDPDWRLKISKFDRSSNMTLMLPTDDGTVRYITVPVAWGLKPIKVTMEYLYDAADGMGDWQDAMRGILTSVAESYNPLAGDENLLNTVTPSVLKVPMEISRNRAWYGDQIRPEYDPNAPDSTKYFRSIEDTLLGRAAVKGTAALSEASNGGIEISPANIVYAFRQYIGGVGRSAEKIINTITGISKGEDVPAKELPVLSRFYKTTDEETMLNRVFYNERERINKEQAQQKISDIRRITPLYEIAQKYLDEGNEEKAQAIVDALSDDDYDVYKKLKAADKRRDTSALQAKMLPVYRSNQELILQGRASEAQAAVEALSDEEYKAYERVKEVLGTSSPKTKVGDVYGRSALGVVSDYARAFVTDPGNALKALLTKEKLGLVEGNLVELQRFYGIDFRDEGGSQEYKRTLMASQGIPWSEAENWKLEHITPVKAGGDNSDGNLMLVDTQMHNFFTPIDIIVGNAVRTGTITRKQATAIMLDFKVYKIMTAEEVIQAIKDK